MQLETSPVGREYTGLGFRTGRGAVKQPRNGKGSFLAGGIGSPARRKHASKQRKKKDSYQIKISEGVLRKEKGRETAWSTAETLSEGSERKKKGK